jgi:hypothetical protein
MKKLVGVVIVVLFSGAVYADGFTTNLIGYWGFDGSGADSSGLGYDLTIYGGAGYAGGLFGQALDLHGDPSQYAARPVDDQIYDFGSSDFTVQAWANYNVVGIEQNLVEKFVGGRGPGWTLTKVTWEAGTDQLHFWSNPSATFTSSYLNLTSNEWYQVVARRSGDLFEILLDGQVIASARSTLPVPDTTVPLLIGERQGRQDFPLNGRIDEVAIWNRSLTDAEISYLWNGGAGNRVTAPVPEPCTIALLGIGALGLIGYGRNRRPQRDAPVA